MAVKHKQKKKPKAKKRLPQNEILERADIYTIHQWDCPHCGHIHEVDGMDEKVVECVFIACSKRVRIG